MKRTQHTIKVADCKRIPLANHSVDLVFCSPPYEAARTYGIGFDLKGQDWIDWALPRFMECLRISSGLVAWVVEGQTRQYRWSATPVRLMNELHRRGVHLRKPPVYQRRGIPGSGGPDWLANHYEFIICATSEGGRLPWSDPVACGHRSNQNRQRRAMKLRKVDGSFRVNNYRAPKKVNPGNIVHCEVGGGHMGHPLSSQNEAAFPETLANFFVRSFCKPGGVVCDPFCGSGTTIAAAVKAGRHGLGFDIRSSQTRLARRRVADVIKQATLNKPKKHERFKTKLAGERFRVYLADRSPITGLSGACHG